MLALQALRELRGRPRPVLGVVLDLEAPRELLDDFRKDGAGDENRFYLYRTFGSQRPISGKM